MYGFYYGLIWLGLLFVGIAYCQEVNPKHYPARRAAFLLSDFAAPYDPLS